MMLKEKIQTAKSCKFYADGRCTQDGYPPFDCENCSSYVDKKVKEAQGE